MTDQEILVKKRQAAFTVCKEVARKNRKLIEEIWGDFQGMVEYVLWDGDRLLGKIDTEKYNEHQIINYLCCVYRTIYRNNIKSYRYNTMSPFASLDRLSNFDEDGNPKEITALGRDFDFNGVDEDCDCKNIVSEVREILKNEAESNYRKANCVDYFEKLMEANWSATKAGEMFGGSKSLWNQRARSVITDVADIIREKYPDYVVSFAQLVGDRRGSSQGHVALTKKKIEGQKIHLRRKDESTKLYFIIKIRMLRFLKENGSSYSGVIAKALGNTDETIRAKGKSLAKEGLINLSGFINENHRKAFKFEINEQGLKYLKEYENVR